MQGRFSEYHEMGQGSQRKRYGFTVVLSARGGSHSGGDPDG